MGDVPERREAPQPGLARRFVIGAVLVGVGGWGTSAFRIALNLVLARLLGPEVFGYYAFLFSVNEILGIAGGFSMGLALIQSSRTSQAHEDTAFALAGVFGLVGVGAALVAAPILGAQRTAEAGTLLVLLALGRSLALLGNVALAKLERALQYRAVSLVNVASSVLPGFAALGLAWWGFGVWSLIVQDVLLGALILLLAITLSGYRFRARWDRSVAAELFAFGRGVFVSRGLEIALQRVDRLLVGTFMGDTRLGFYHQGRFLAETGLVVGRPLERVTLNLYARIQNAPGHLEQAFGLTQFFLVRLMFAGAAVLLVVPEATVQLLLGAAWLPAAPILVAMTLHAALAPPLANTKQLLYGRGEVGKSVAVRLVELGCFLPLLAAGIVFDDIRMAAFGLSIATCVGLVLALWFSRDVAGPVLRRDFAMPVIALAAALVLWLAPVRERLDALPDLVVPLVPVLIYAGVLFTLDGAAIARNLRTLRASFAQRG